MTRIIGSIIVILIVSGLGFLLNKSDSPTPNQVHEQTQTPSESNFKNLSVN